MSAEIPGVNIDSSDQTKKVPAKIPEYNPPEDVYVEITKHINKIKNLERDLEQNILRGKNLCAECFNLMSAAEIITFDLQLFDFMLTPVNPRNDEHPQWLNFIAECTRVAREGMSVDAISKHIRYVYVTMETAVANIMNQMDMGQNRFPGASVQLQQMIQDTIAREVQKFDEPCIQKELEPVEIKLPEETSQPDAVKENPVVTQEFEEEITNLLKAEKLTESVAHMRGIVGAMAHKFHQIEKLKLQNEDLKMKYMDPSSSIQCIPPEVIDKSPFMQSARETYSFLLKISNKIRVQAASIPLILEDFQNAKEVLAKTAEDCQKITKAVTDYNNEVCTRIEQIHDEATSSKEVIQPYLDLLFSTENNKSISSLNEENEKMRQKVSDLLKECMDSFEEGSDDYNTLQIANELFDQLKDIREPIIEKCKANQQEFAKWKDAQQELFNAVSCTSKDAIKNEGLSIIGKLYVDLNSMMERLRDEFTEKIENSSKVEQWSNLIQSAEENLRMSAENQSVTAQFSELNEEEDNREIEEIEAELEKLEKEEEALDKEYTEIGNELACEKEKAFIKLQECDAYSDFVPAPNEKKYKKYKNMIVCPVCKENIRDHLFLKCKHIVCEECAKKGDETDGEKSTKVCPVCSKQCNSDECVRIYLQI